MITLTQVIKNLISIVESTDIDTDIINAWADFSPDAKTMLVIQKKFTAEAMEDCTDKSGTWGTYIAGTKAPIVEIEIAKIGKNLTIGKDMYKIVNAHKYYIYNC